MINGIINVYKEKGYTSHDVVAKLRGICRQKKIGHTGTLDPDATGVLPVCLGKATKVCGMLTDSDKAYEAVLLLGKTTDTQDISGTVLKEQEADITEEQVTEVLSGFAGSYDQVPPMYSALKVNGKKLYELARQGIEVERKARTVQIHSIEILDFSLPRIKIRVHCSKGTYIRTLCHDAGEQLGCGGCMEELVRIKAGMFPLAQSRSLKELETLAAADRLAEAVMPVDQVFQTYPAVTILAKGQPLVNNGNAFPAVFCQPGTDQDNEGAAELMLTAGEYRVYGQDGSFAAIYRYDPQDSMFKPVKMFFDR